MKAKWKTPQLKKLNLEETKAVEEILSGPAPKTGEESRILIFSALLGMSVTVIGGTIYRIKMKKGANGTL